MMADFREQLRAEYESRMSNKMSHCDVWEEEIVEEGWDEEYSEDIRPAVPDNKPGWSR